MATDPATANGKVHPASGTRFGHVSMPPRAVERVAAYLESGADALLRRAPEPVERAAIVLADYVRLLVAPVRIGQFVSVGVVGGVCENLLLVGLVEASLLPPVAGAALAKETSIAVMFVLNERWTFAEAGDGGTGNVLRRFLRSNVVRAGGAVTGLAVLALLHRGLGVHYLLANVLGIGVGFFVNYVAENLVTWRVHAE